MASGVSSPLNAQTVRTVGSTGNYTTLKLAFDAINAGSVTGAIVLQVTSDLTETATASLNASGSGSANYSSLVIYPTITATITGNFSGNLISLNGADNVTFDGRINQTGSTKSLTITKLVDAAAIQFLNDASNNGVRYCSIKSINTSTLSGTIFFSTGIVTGNDNNTIENCDIGDGASTPTNAIYSNGTSLAVDNSNIIVNSCNIHNYYSTAAASNGIFVAANSSKWTISANKFYQGATRNATATGYIHRAINILTASGVDYAITNNTIGYLNEAGTGITSYTSSAGLINRFIAIEMTVGASPTSQVQGNTIAGISLANSEATAITAAPGIFSGISILGGAVNIGTTSGNTIGNATSLGSINITSSATTNYVAGIYAATTATINIQNNNIGGIALGGAAAIGHTFRAIHTTGTGGSFNISSNTIGSTSTSNSIAVGISGTTTTGSNVFYGIHNAATGTISITLNTIQNIYTYGGTSTSAYYGIYNAGGTGTLNINENNLISGSNAGTGGFVAITNTAAVNTLTINNNIIRNHTLTSTSCTFTAISNTGVVLDFIAINYNQLGNLSGGLVSYTAASTVALLGISNTGGAASCELSIQNNTIRGISNSVVAASAHTYFYNSAATLKQDINYNTLTALSVFTTGAIIFISNSVIMPTNGIQNVNYNSIATSFTRTGTSGALTLFTSTSATNNNNVTVNNNGNNFSNITLSGTATISGWINTDAGFGSYTKTIDGNTFSTWVATGAVVVMNVAISSPNNAVSNNTISSISTTSTLTAITTGVGYTKIFSNIINGLASTGGTSTVLTGISVTAATETNIYNNTISTLTENSFRTGSLRGIYIGGGTKINIYQNNIFGLLSAAVTTGTVSGIWVAAGSNINLERNKIYNLSCTGTAMTTGAIIGVQVSGTTANMIVNISNNLISDIRTPSMSSSSTIRGLSIINTGTTSSINAYFNTILMNAAAGGTNFGSSCIYHVGSATATTSKLYLRNNIIVNNSIQKGSGLVVALLRTNGATTGTLANFDRNSNNNLLYAGTPSATRLIYSDASGSATTLANYKIGSFTAGIIAPRDQASVTENPTFISTTGTSPDFLRLSPSVATQIESGAVNIASLTNDYDGVIRQGNPGYAGTSTTSPDIGAYEGNHILTDNAPPSITYTLLTNSPSSTSQSLSAMIYDATGVNITAGTKPRVYFKRSTDSNTIVGNTSATAGWKWVEASNTSAPYDFAFNYSLLSGGAGVSAGNSVQYFVVAQDTKVTPIVGINAGTFASTPTSVALTTAALPTTLNSFTILTGLSGNVTIGNTGATYTSLTGAAGLFNAINTNGLKGDLTVTIIGASASETGAISLNSINYSTGSNYTVTIKPNTGVAASISGSFAGSLINLNGADNVIFDGLNTGGSSMTIQNINTGTGTSTIRFINDASNNTIQNCTIAGCGTGTGFGTILFSTGTSTGNDNNTVSNNTITSVSTNLPTNAIYSGGSTVLIDNSDNIINSNNIQDYFNATIASNGIYLAQNSSKWTITGNHLYQTNPRSGTTNAVTHRAIQIVTASGVNYTINNNVIGYSASTSIGTSTYSATIGNTYSAIELTVGTAIASNVQGNTIAGFNFSTTSAATLPGIFSGIYVRAGSVNIGTTLGNTIGVATGINSIVVSSTTTAAVISGIYSVSSGTVSIENNVIGGISVNGAAAIGYSFYGIYTAGLGEYSITSNQIGSLATANSISIGTSGTTTTGVCAFYGITNTTTGVISISNNTIQNCTSFGTGASVLTGIVNSGISGLVNINGNNIISVSTTGSGTLLGISNSSASSALNINNNVIRGILKTVAGGAVTAISNTGAVLSAININNNQLGNDDGGLITYSTIANTGTLTGINNASGSASCDLSIQGNDFKGINYVVAGANTNTYISNTAATLTQEINSNTFTNLSANTTGSVTFISNSIVMPTNGIQNVNSNSIVTAFAKPAVGGTITLFTSTTSTNNANVTVNNNNNNFSNMTFTGATAMAGWVNTDAGLGNVVKTIDGNTFSNWTGGASAVTVMNVNITSPNNATSNNNISTITCAANVNGITTAAGNDNIFSNTIQGLVSTLNIGVVNGIAISTAGTVKNVYLNTIFNLQNNSLTTGAVSGISISSGFTNNVYRNKIYNISSSSSGITTGTTNGILVSGTVADQVVNINNNKIGDIKATAASATSPVCGISVINTGLRSTTNVYYNTVHLNASSTGVNFGTSGIYHTANATATTAKLDLRNNIVANRSTFSGSGTTVAFRRSSGTAGLLANYASTSNNNLFYAGYPSNANNLLYSDVNSTAQTLAAYKAGVFTAGTIAPRDQASISENPVFISTTGSSVDFLKIDNSVASFIESGAANISSYTDDYDSDIRSGNLGYPAQSNGYGTSPDIGADEFDGIKPSVVVINSNDVSNGNYATLSAAFTSINAQDQTGKSIGVTILSTTNETTTATLNPGAWTILTVYPTTTSLSIAGNLAAPLVNLNGGDNVVIDGRVNQTGTTASLIIENSSTSATAGTSTIRFIESAENNIVKYCNVKGSSMSTADGVILYSTASAGNGNDNNLLDNCFLTNSGGNRPINMIYSLGASGYENNSNTISNNRIYNFLNASASSNGIHIGAYSTDWNVSTNSSYETTSFVPTSGSFVYNALRIDNTSGNNFIINGNYFGGQAVLCGGSPWSADAATNHSIRVLSLNVGTSTASSIQNNVIRNWSYRSASATPWQGIHIQAGTVNVGTATANVIGSNTGTGSITLTATSDGESCGIHIAGTNTVTVSKNQIGSITVVGNSSNVSHSFFAIHKAAVTGSVILSDNIIGSTATSNSIQANSTATTSTTPQQLCGIFSESTSSASISTNTVANLNNAYGGTLSSRTNGIRLMAGMSIVTNNTIYNLSSASLGTNGSVVGLELNGSDDIKMIAENVIYGLSNSGTTYSGYVAGIAFSGSTGGSQLNANFIRTLTVNAASTAASVYGIRVTSGLNTLSNNIISLGGTTATTLYGIYETGDEFNDNWLYFNTVYINGSLGSGITNKSYALYSNASTNNRDFRNNIFSNFRSTTGGSNLHYAAYFNYGTDVNLTLDHNDYYAPGTGGVIGYYNGTNKTALPIVPTFDANSFNVNPSFVIAGGSNAVNYKLNAALNGEIGLIDVSLDYEKVARGTPPNLGAFEFYTNRWTGATSTDFGVASNWSSSTVPGSGAQVVFDESPLNDCVLDINRTIGNITNMQSSYKFVVNGKQLTINGGLYFHNAAQMDAKTASSTLVFAGSTAQVIPENALVDNTVENLTINNANGVTSDGNLIVENVLNLLSANPSDSKGSLDIASAMTLTLGSLSSIIGNGDVTGVVKRTAIAASTEYVFSNKNTKVTFGATGTLPTDVRVKLTLGAAPSWKPTAMKRIYEFAQTDGNNLFADVAVGYLQSELNGNDENKLVYWSANGFPSPTTTEWGFTTLETANNWISISNIPINLWATEFGLQEIALAATEYPTLTWNGIYSTLWNDANNWTPSGFPTKYATTIVPNATTTTYDPIVPVTAEINSMGIQSGGIVDVSSGTQLTLHATSMNGWSNAGGTFNAGNSTVNFKNVGATISGTTSFNNVAVLTGGGLTPLASSTMHIAGTLSNAGTLDATAYSNTIDYNGGNQTIIKPNGAISGYHHLTLSGNNTKTMPTSALNMIGDFTLSGSAVVAPTHSLSINGNLIVGSGTSFTAGSLNHDISGNVMNNGGTFTLTGSSIVLNGTVAQTIGGTSTSTFNNLTIDNTNGITLTNNETFNGLLTLTNGLITTDTYTLTKAGTASISGASATNHIDGKLAEIFSTTGTYHFPIGKGGIYRPLTIQLSALTGTTTLTAEQFEGTLPGTLPANTDLFSDRYWQITQSGGSGHSYLLTLDGTSWSRVGTPKMLKGNGSTNTAYYTSGTNYTNSSAFTSFGYFGLAESAIEWNGSVNTNWFNSSNWSSGYVPSGTYDIVIPSSLSTYPVISGTSPAQDITISDGTALTLNNGATLTLESGPVLTFESGAITSTGGTSKIIVQSDASYLNLSTSGPTLEMQRDLTGTKGWRMLASPVAGSYSDLFKAPLVTQGFTGASFPTLQPNLLWWLESDGGTTLQSFRKPTNLTDNLVTGRGYFHYAFNGAGRLNLNGSASGFNYPDALPITMSVTGIEPYNGTGTYDFNLSYTPKAPSQTPSPTDTTYYDLNELDEGWNLIGNPTASTLDWDAIEWTKTDLDNTIYIWDPSALSGNGDYLTWNGTTGTLGNGRIPPFQSFWVHATDNNTLSFTNAVKTGTTGTFLRSAATTETIIIPLTLTLGNLQTTSFITFSENGVTGPDPLDGYRLESMSNTWLSLYTLSSPGQVSPLVINNLPLPEEDLTDIPLYFDAQVKENSMENYTLHWVLPENLPANWKISLQDHRNEFVLSMMDNSDYSFNSTTGKALTASLNELPLPNKLVKGLSDNSLLRSNISLPPFSIVVSKGSDIDYLEPKPQLLGNFPNPFDIVTDIRFSLPKKANVRLDIFSSQGSHIATIADKQYNAGITNISWNATNIPPGIYFIRFICGETVETKKAILIK